MAFKVKSFREVLTMSKEALDETLAPIRARSAKAKADLYSSKLEETMVGLEREITELCTSKELDFDKVISKIDQYELAERKVKQVNALIADLFPAAPEK